MSMTFSSRRWKRNYAAMPSFPFAKLLQPFIVETDQLPRWGTVVCQVTQTEPSIGYMHLFMAVFTISRVGRESDDDCVFG